MLQRPLLIALLVALWCPVAGHTQSARESDRGELLYSTHCITCHSDQMHWREKRSVTDWKSPQAQVRRWQGVAGLGWTEEDVGEVARYLNALYYRLPNPA